MVDEPPVPTAQPRFPAGTVLQGRYRLGEVIGEGAMGTVYRGERIGLHRPVAIKFLLPAVARDASFVKRFGLEADAQACVFSDECCGKRCLPQPDGTRKCSATSVPNGGPCTAHADCMSGNCNAIRLVCEPPVDADCCSKTCNPTSKTCYVITID